jgi:hypothetical protein
MNQDYWRQQEPGKLLFPDVEWSKPERRSARGKLLIVGGSAHGFAGVGKAYTVASETGAGSIRLALPDVLEKKLPKDIDGIFLPTSSGGGIGKDGLDDLMAAVDWADGVLLVGDSGQNSETTIMFEKIIKIAPKQKWFTVTRDAVDLIRGMGEDLANQKNVNLVMSFAQIQKLFSSVYYPKILTHSMQLATVIDAMHKFTITYPITLAMIHNDHLIVASDGEVISQNNANMMDLINGTVAAKSATYLLWDPTKPLEAIASSWV